VDLAKDLVIGNYFPRVVHPQRHSSTTISKSGNSPSSSKVLGSAGPPKALPKTEVKQNFSTPGVYPRWKKRARQSQACNNQTIPDGSMEGEQKGKSPALGGDDYPSKKDRKTVEGHRHSLKIQAEAMAQPYPSK
jgi:hypothetical protein